MNQSDDFFKQKLLDVHQEIAANLRANLESMRSDQTLINKELFDLIGALTTRIEIISQKDSNSKENSAIIKSIIKVVGALVGAIALGLAIIKDALK